MLNQNTTKGKVQRAEKVKEWGKMEHQQLKQLSHLSESKVQAGLSNSQAYLHITKVMKGRCGEVQ